MKLYIDTADNKKIIIGLDDKRWEFETKEHKSQVLLDLINQTIKKRTGEAKIFPNIESCSQLIGALLLEKSEQWLDSKFYISQT